MDDYLPWLRLINAPGLGSKSILSLLKHFSTAENILSASDNDLRDTGITANKIRSIRQESSSALQQQQSWLQQPLHHMITYKDEKYPDRLKQIPDPPVALFIAGDVDLLHRQQLAIVGSRNPTRPGCKMARQLASQLAEFGFIINSGLAMGIDYYAHEGALDTGRTIGVLGNGPDIIYPARHRNFAGEIINKGALVSEFPPGTLPLANHFPRRNRLISGLSLGVIVIEATVNSGSLITARCAMEQDREVFAVPGPVQSALSRGCHHLIKQGAKLVETIVDVLDEIQHEQLPLELEDLHKNGNSQDKKGVSVDDEYQSILQYLSFSPQSLDELIELSGLTAETVSSMLLVLEVQGIVLSEGGQYIKIN